MKNMSVTEHENGKNSSCYPITWECHIPYANSKTLVIKVLFLILAYSAMPLMISGYVLVGSLRWFPALVCTLLALVYVLLGFQAKHRRYPHVLVVSNSKIDFASQGEILSILLIFLPLLVIEIAGFYQQITLGSERSSTKLIALCGAFVVTVIGPVFLHSTRRFSLTANNTIRTSYNSINLTNAHIEVEANHKFATIEVYDWQLDALATIRTPQNQVMLTISRTAVEPNTLLSLLIALANDRTLCSWLLNSDEIHILDVPPITDREAYSRGSTRGIMLARYERHNRLDASHE